MANMPQVGETLDSRGVVCERNCWLQVTGTY